MAGFRSDAVTRGVDSTVPVVTGYGEKEPRLRCVVNTYGRRPANAIRYGIDVAAAPVAVVTMADGCDATNSFRWQADGGADPRPGQRARGESAR